MKAVLLSVILVLGMAPASFAQTDAEPRPSTTTSGQLRMLVQRAARQYMMYQYGVGNLAVTKEPLLATVEQVDATLKRLAAGDSMPGAAPVSSPEIEAQVKLIAEKWDRLQKIYTYQPYMLFQAKELLPAAVRKQDPVLVRYVDRLTQELLSEAQILVEAYARHCDTTGSPACQERVREAGKQMLLVEAVTTNLLFTVLDIDRSDRRKKLRELTDQLDSALEQARAPDYYGENPSVLIAPALETIAAYWSQIRASINLALGGNEDDVDINQMLRSQQRLIEEIENLSLILLGR